MTKLPFILTAVLLCTVLSACETAPVTSACAPQDTMLWMHKNNPNPSFGCATRSNLEAAVVNSDDFTSPAAEGPVNATRTTTVVQKLRRGESTTSAPQSPTGATTLVK